MKTNYKAKNNIKNSKSLTIVTGTYNPNIQTFTLMLESIKKQNYHGKIKHVILDGGSNNGSINLAKKYGCIVRISENSADEGLSRYYSNVKYIKGDIVIILESDNILPTNKWISEIVEPFDDKDIFASYPAYNTFYSTMNILTRYTALLGSPDPTLYYLGKSDKIPVFKKRYDKGVILEETKKYYKVRFINKTLPTVGDNGFAVRTNIFKNLIKKNKIFYHTDRFEEILSEGYDTYGVTKNAIIHTTKLDILNAVRRRVDVKKHFTDELKGKRAYLVYNPNSKKDRLKLFLFIVYSLTIIQPLAISIYGCIYKPDIAWFLHPIMCIFMVFGYGYSEIERMYKRYLTGMQSI